MLVEICLAIIAVALIFLTSFMVVTSYQYRKIIQLIQKDVHNVSQEAAQVLSTINTFIHADLHSVSQETHHLLSEIASISSDVKQKINSVNFLFRPLHSLNPKLDSEEPSDNPDRHYHETIPKILKWIVSGMSLINITKEFVKHGKQK